MRIPAAHPMLSAVGRVSGRVREAPDPCQEEAAERIGESQDGSGVHPPELGQS
jgi:hypothetical protein